MNIVTENPIIPRQKERRQETFSKRFLTLLVIASAILIQPMGISRAAVADNLQITEYAQNKNWHSVDLSEILANGKPTLILFTPVEMCQIRYCLQLATVKERLTEHYTGQINLVEALVYAVDTVDKPRLPMVNLGVYLVEPYANWVPEMVHTQFGWEIDAPNITLVNASGYVVYHSDDPSMLKELTNILEDK